MIFVWLLAGCAMVTAAFFIPGTSTELWPNMTAAGIAAFVYLLALFAFIFRDIRDRVPRLVGWFFMFAIAVWTAIFWSNFRTTTQWQHDTLLEIEHRIVRGVIASEFAPPLFTTLASYHHQGRRNRLSVGATFTRLFPADTVGANYHEKKWPEDNLACVVQSVDADRVVVVAFDGYSKGNDPSFKNFNGSAGLIQLRATLTEKGIDYEWQN